MNLKTNQKNWNIWWFKKNDFPDSTKGRISEKLVVEAHNEVVLAFKNAGFLFCIQMTQDTTFIVTVSNIELLGSRKKVKEGIWIFEFYMFMAFFMVFSF